MFNEEQQFIALKAKILKDRGLDCGQYKANYLKPSIFSRIMRKVDPVKEIEVETRKIFKKVFSIPHSVEIYETHRKGLPISHFASRCKAGVAYQKIAEEAE